MYFDLNVPILPSLIRSDGIFFNYISLKLEINKLQFNPHPGLTPFYATPRIVLFSFGCDVFIHWYNFEYNSSKCSCWGELSDYNTISYFLGVKKNLSHMIQGVKHTIWRNCTYIHILMLEVDFDILRLKNSSRQTFWAIIC